MENLATNMTNPQFASAIHSLKGEQTWQSLADELGVGIATVYRWAAGTVPSGRHLLLLVKHGLDTSFLAPPDLGGAPEISNHRAPDSGSAQPTDENEAA